ncbi:group II truncated hemoglobin [Limnobacter sp.]|uniref:group II truncated hemoglobin n=1 Tax=Limnobacter sp. TaxID=2003368 RepID=UPI003512030D
MILFQAQTMSSNSPNQTSPEAHTPVPPIHYFGDSAEEQAVGVRKLVDLFYDEMDTNPAFERIRKLHPNNLDHSREKFYLFLSGWLGGADLYTPKFGHPRLRMRHMPFPIASEDRDQWLLCMVNALRAMALPERVIEGLMLSFFRTADWMRNQPDPPGASGKTKLSIRAEGQGDD